jgi:hypothetical protein
MSAARQSHTATRLNDGRVLVAGGCCTDDASAELYNPARATWARTVNLNTGRFEHTATLLNNGRVLVAGGMTKLGGLGDSATAELYDRTTGIWSRTASMQQSRMEHTATLLNSGQVLVAGGTQRRWRPGLGRAVRRRAAPVPISIQPACWVVGGQYAARCGRPSNQRSSRACSSYSRSCWPRFEPVCAAGPISWPRTCYCGISWPS